MHVNAEDFNTLSHKSYNMQTFSSYLTENRLFLQDKDHLVNVVF